MPFLFQAKLDRALGYYLQSLETAQRIGDLDGISQAYRNIGLAYYKLQNYDKALVYYAASISIETNIGEFSELPSLWLNMSLCYTQKRNFVEAGKCISKSYCVQGCSRENFMALSFCEGSIALGLERFEVAKDHFLRSYALAIAERDIRFQLDNIVCLTHIYIQGSRLDEVERYLREATTLINESVALNLELIKVYALFVEFYGLKNNWQKQAAYQQRYIGLKDSIYNDRVTNSLMKIESMYLERENTAKLAAQEQILALEEVISRQNLVNIFASLFSLSLMIIAVLLCA